MLHFSVSHSVFACCRWLVAVGTCFSGRRSTERCICTMAYESDKKGWSILLIWEKCYHQCPDFFLMMAWSHAHYPANEWVTLTSLRVQDDSCFWQYVSSIDLLFGGIDFNQKVYMQNAYIHASCFCRFVVVPRLACPSASSLWWSAASDWDDAEKAGRKTQVSFLSAIILL